MKKIIIPLFVIIIIFLFSCSSMNYLTIGVTEPAPVYLSKKIQTIGILDRSLPADKNSNINILDKILTAEGPNLDKDAAQKSVNGLFDELKSYNKFVDVKIINTEDFRTSGLGVFPTVLAWEQVDKVCKQNNVDAIFVLSYFDTDAKIEYSINPVQLKTPLGVVNTVETQASVFTYIKTGWRIYDPINKIICDEYSINRNVVTTGKGINPMKAAEAIIGRKEAVFNSSNDIGHEYATRILEKKIRVSREYFVRGTDNFKIGKRRAQAGNWDGAAELWEKELENPKMKIAGRACYNMAIINEINGNLDEALNWATKSFTDYNNKPALRYINTLKYRINKENQLQRNN